jgi:Aminoglycoside-2''-adenylyltransferase
MTLTTMRDGLTLIRLVLDLLEDAGCSCFLFGGWAEEIRGLSEPRAHKDIDLLYPAQDFELVDQLLGTRIVEEIDAKRFPHKRAFEVYGIMVELFLVREDDRGHFTDFWGETRFDWPSDLAGKKHGLPVVSPAALTAYRDAHPTLRPHG